MLKELVIRFSLLIVCLFFVLSGVWVFLAGREGFSFLVRDAIFVVQVILVLVVVAILCVLIFMDSIRLRLSELVGKLEERGQIFEEEKKHILNEAQSGVYEDKEKLNYVFSYIRDGVILLDRSRGVVLLNRAAEEIAGKSQADARGRQIGEVFKLFEEDREIQVDEYLRDDLFLRKHLRLESISATTKLVDFICVRLALIHTQDLGYMVVLHTITGELEVEKKQVGLLSAFASELRQPFELIGTSNGGTGVLQLSVLMENLLTVGALTGGKVEVSIVDVDLVALVNELVLAVGPLAAQCQISVEVDVKDDMAARVRGDESRIRQIFLNLLINAIKYTKSGGKVIVSLSSTDEAFIFHIQDTGIGIKGEDMNHLFEKFFVGGNVPPEDCGIGLGLYVCKGLTDLMDGKIWVDSVEGRGTVASVSFSRLK
jgi:PAS domain S-box-containing protein